MIFLHSINLNRKKNRGLFTYGKSNQCLPQNELRDLLDVAVPVSWQKEMCRHGFDPINQTVQQFMEFWKRFESTEDIQQNLARNEKEYSYDGNDWRTAKEETDFLRCSSSSSSSSLEDLVHPAHFSNRSSSQPYWNSGSASIPSSRNDDYRSNAKERSEEDADYSEGIFEMDWHFHWWCTVYLFSMFMCPLWCVH